MAPSSRPCPHTGKGQRLPEGRRLSWRDPGPPLTVAPTKMSQNLNVAAAATQNGFQRHLSGHGPCGRRRPAVCLPIAASLALANSFIHSFIHSFIPQTSAELLLLPQAPEAVVMRTGRLPVPAVPWGARHPAGAENGDAAEMEATEEPAAGWEPLSGDGRRPPQDTQLSR